MLCLLRIQRSIQYEEDSAFTQSSFDYVQRPRSGNHSEQGDLL